MVRFRRPASRRCFSVWKNRRAKATATYYIFSPSASHFFLHKKKCRSPAVRDARHNYQLCRQKRAGIATRHFVVSVQSEREVLRIHPRQILGRCRWPSRKRKENQKAECRGCFCRDVMVSRLAMAVKMSQKGLCHTSPVDFGNRHAKATTPH